MSKHKYLAVESYFSEYTPKSMYLAGFILADAYIRDDNTRHCVSFHLSEKDIDLLTYIQGELCQDAPIRKNIYKNKKTNKSYNSCLLTVSNRKILSDLKKIGIDDRKSGNEQISPLIPKELWSNFILGFFDGDGSCVKSNKKNGYIAYAIKIASLSKYILEQIQNFCQVGTIRLESRKTNKPLYVYCIDSFTDIYTFYNCIYNNSNHFHLNRKKAIIEECIAVKDKYIDKKISAYGDNLTIKEWALRFDITPDAMKDRFYNPNLHSLSNEEILSLPKSFKPKGFGFGRRK